MTHDLGAPHSPISARSCSDTFTRSGWGRKAEEKSGSALVHFPSAASRAGRSWGYGAHARATLKPAWRGCPALLHHRPMAISAAREVRAGDLTHRAHSTHPSTQHTTSCGAAQWDPAPSEGALGPRSTNGSVWSPVLTARTLLSCLCRASMHQGSCSCATFGYGPYATAHTNAEEPAATKQCQWQKHP